MTKILIDRAVVEQLLEALETPIHEQSFMQKQNAITNLRAALAEPQPNTLQGWVFKRNADGSIGIFAPPPKPGESQRTSDCVGTNQRDLNELLGKLADHMAALAEPETCTWQQDGDSDSGSYGTSCRRYFNLEDGTPEDNKMAWCCYCGKKLAQALITEDEDD